MSALALARALALVFTHARAETETKPRTLTAAFITPEIHNPPEIEHASEFILHASVCTQ